MATVKATLVIQWEDADSKFALLHLMEDLEKQGLLDTVLKIEVVE